MKVLHISKSSPLKSFGGVETMIKDLCEVTSELGVQNTVLCLDDLPEKDPTFFQNTVYYEVRRDFQIFSTGFSWRASKLFKKLGDDADVIHYHYPNPFCDLLYLLYKHRKKKSVITYHADIQRYFIAEKLYTPIRKIFFNGVDKIVTTSEAYIDSSPVLKNFKDKLIAIPIGIDLDNIDRLGDNLSSAWKAKSSSRGIALFIGAHRHYKGIEFAMRALANKQYDFLIAGHGEMTSQLVDLCEHLKATNIYFLGKISDEQKWSLLRNCDVFVFPSNNRSEAFGIALLEASAIGKPMVTCDIKTATSYINIHEETGLVVKPNSVGELAEAVDFLISNRDIAVRFGQNARKRVENRFSLRAEAEMYVKLYQSL